LPAVRGNTLTLAASNDNATISPTAKSSWTASAPAPFVSPTDGGRWRPQGGCELDQRVRRDGGRRRNVDRIAAAETHQAAGLRVAEEEIHATHEVGDRAVLRQRTFAFSARAGPRIIGKSR
jgi:hypothetical protein